MPKDSPQPANAAPGGGEEDVYRSLVESVVDYAIYRLDPDGRVVSWNRGAENIKGYAAEEVLGRHFSEFFTEADRAEGAPERVLQAARAKGRHETEGWRQRKDGSRFWALAIVDTIYGPDGAILGFAKITRDMTERREAQRRLEESERQFRLLVAGVSDYALYMISPQGIVSSWNAGAARIKGYAETEIVGQHFRRFYTVEERDAGVPERALQTARDTGRYEAEGWRLRKDGSRFWANVVIDAIYDEGGQLHGFAKITRDITERRENQIRLDEVRQQLFQAQKMESIGQLTGGVAHDFNNLLTVIVGGVNIARRRIDDPERLATLLDNIAEAADRGASLTKQLLAFSRRQSLTPESIRLEVMLPGFVELLDRSLGGQVEVSIDIEPGTCVMADLRQLELALLNVALNGRDAMPDGGRIAIKANRLRLDEPNGLNGDFVAIAVSDTGTGMTEELIERVFEPFFTTKEVGRGTGLGLSQAYGFAQQSGGTVRITSRLGKGTTVTFMLPEATGAVAAVPDKPAEADHDLVGRRILVVEDDSSVAEITCDMLREAGAVVTLATGVAEAFEILEKQGFDLVFSDVVMPGGFNGFDLANRLKAERPELAVVLATGYSGSVASRTADFKVLSKPYVTADMFKAVKEALAETSRQLQSAAPPGR